ncbi:MAG TPA: pilus assembly protein TadG-related protein [Ktedonobacterales bacterium]
MRHVPAHHGAARPVFTRRSLRRRRSAARQAGQTLIIFVLTLTVLLGIVGLAIDAVRLYDLYARAERAAEAGALAGVLYMPCFYNSATSGGGGNCAAGNSPDGDSAASRAMREVFKDGFGSIPGSATIASACPNPVGSVEVAVCQVPGKATDLSVTVTEPIAFFFLGVVGIGPSSVSATAQAEYLPPIHLGSRLNYFGDETQQNFRAVINGPGDLKQFGDAYVYCEEGPSAAPPQDIGPGQTAYNGISTNHDQYYVPGAWPGGTLPQGPNCGINSPGNPDQQPSGFVGPATQGTAHPGAKNYLISADASATVWIYNPNYIPTDNTPRLDHFQAGGGQTYYAQAFANNAYDDPNMYFNMTYTVYRVPSLFLRTTDQVVSSKVFKPFDMMSGDLTNHGCSTAPQQVYDLSQASSYPGPAGAGGCFAYNNLPNNNGCPGAFHGWCQIATLSKAGNYRLAVEDTGVNVTTEGWGSHQYAAMVCNSGAPPGAGCVADSGTTMAAWNNMTVFYFASGNTADFDLANIPAVYAGRSISIGIFDPGDGSGNITVRIVPPVGSGAAVAPPPGIRSGTDDLGAGAILASQTNDSIYNGRWITTVVNLPATYTGGWWQVHYDATGSPSDTVTVKLNLIGSPVHLVTPG